MEPAIDLMVINAQRALAAVDLAFSAFSGSQGFLEHIPSIVCGNDKGRRIEYPCFCGLAV
jgi:hypothetical protein